jgi:sterol 3beta-glucosyltransferase
MRISILVFGTRGEVQPLVALGLGLQAAGHAVRIITQDTFHDFVASQGLACVPIKTGLREAVQSRRKAGNYTLPTIYKLARQYIRQSLGDVWEGCQDAEALIMCDIGTIPGWHIVDKLRVPTFVVSYYPEEICQTFWETTLRGKIAARLERFGMSVISSQLILKPFINAWRKTQLGLPPVSHIKENTEELKARQTPVFYAYSDTVFPKPPEWPAWWHVTGYWFLQHSASWQAPSNLVEFLADGPPPVYVGFSSVDTRKMAGMTDLVLRALALGGQRGILAAGWSTLGKRSTLPEGVFTVESIPHDWLFPQVAAAVHHGGAGTTAMGLRCGIPNIIIPFAFDNPFWAWRVAELGVGLPGLAHQTLTAEHLAETIQQTVQNEAMQARRTAISERLRAEDGVARAVELFHHYV